MTVAISGASGLVGSALAGSLRAAGVEVLPLVRRPAGPGEIAWDPERGTVDEAKLARVEAIVHLAGESIAGGRWTPERRRRIVDSRVRGTSLLARHATGKTLVSASAVGYYGNRPPPPVDETAASGSGFLAETVRAWEAAAENPEARVVRLRFGVILSPRGGALAKMLLPFRLGLGGPVGSGKQGLSWISLEDAVGAIRFALDRADLRGACNATSPNPVPQREFARALGRVLRRPAFLPLPSLAVGAIWGAMGKEALVEGQYVLPRRLLAAGFPFRHPDLEEALRFELAR